MSNQLWIEIYIEPLLVQSLRSSIIGQRQFLLQVYNTAERSRFPYLAGRILSAACMEILRLQSKLVWNWNNELTWHNQWLCCANIQGISGILKVVLWLGGKRRSTQTILDVMPRRHFSDCCLNGLWLRQVRCLCFTSSLILKRQTDIRWPHGFRRYVDSTPKAVDIAFKQCATRRIRQTRFRYTCITKEN